MIPIFFSFMLAFKAPTNSSYVSFTIIKYSRWLSEAVETRGVCLIDVLQDICGEGVQETWQL
jgi:hypothetical protein